MKKTVANQSLAQFQYCKLSKGQQAKIKGGAEDRKEDIVIVDVITP